MLPLRWQDGCLQFQAKSPTFSVTRVILSSYQKSQVWVSRAHLRMGHLVSPDPSKECTTLIGQACTTCSSAELGLNSLQPHSDWKEKGKGGGGSNFPRKNNRVLWPKEGAMDIRLLIKTNAHFSSKFQIYLSLLNWTHFSHSDIDVLTS